MTRPIDDVSKRELRERIAELEYAAAKQAGRFCYCGLPSEPCEGWLLGSGCYSRGSAPRGSADWCDERDKRIAELEARLESDRAEQFMHSASVALSAVCEARRETLEKAAGMVCDHSENWRVAGGSARCAAQFDQLEGRIRKLIEERDS